MKLLSKTIYFSYYKKSQTLSRLFAFKQRKVLFLKTFLVTLLLPFVAFSSESLIIPLPYSPDHTNIEKQARTQKQSPDYLISQGKVLLKVPNNYLNTSFNLQFPDSAKIAIIFSEREDSNDIISLWGRTADSKTLNTTMTIGKQNYFLTVNDHKKAETYNITGNIATGEGRYQRFDNRTYRLHIRHATPLKAPTPDEP